MATYDSDMQVYTRSLPMKEITDVASATVTYRGYAPIGTANSASAWRISRSTVSGSATTLEWAGTSASFANSWNNRAGLIYG